MILFNNELCSGCSACANKCPQHCISMVSNIEGFSYPIINAENCVKCNECEKVCPLFTKININDKTQNPLAYAVKNLDETIRMQSSSGGVFSLIAEYVIKKGGVVFGASFNDNFKQVQHIAVDKIEDLGKLRCSKYVQSQVGDSFRKTEKFLSEGRIVLFTGTPCQIAGLKHFLLKDYSNLITQDIICHGVPSPKVWIKYLDFLERNNGSSIKDINFRYKAKEASNYCVYYKFKNNKVIITNASNDIYMKGFLSNLYLRKSCYKCGFKGLNRNSDITLADFWGIDKILPKLHDNKGVSLVLLHSNTGRAIFENIKCSVICESVDVLHSISFNTSAIESASENRYRKLFFNNFSKEKINVEIIKYTRTNFMIRCKKRFMKCFFKLKQFFTGE